MVHKRVYQLMEAIPSPRDIYVVPSLALQALTSKTGNGVYASSDTLYRGAVFGRDSLEVAEDLMHIRPKLVHQILLTMARTQGRESNLANEEEKGKIIHELRTAIVDGKPIRGKQRQIFDNLSQACGGQGLWVAYYGSVDSTPHFLRVLGTYCAAYGSNILDERVDTLHGEQINLRESADNALGWVIGKLASSESGLIEYNKPRPEGMGFLNQAWKDSEEFYVHENGEDANHNRPISSIEVQALAYDGLLAAAKILPDKSDEYLARAQTLRDLTIDLLWQPERNYFALGTDYDDAGKLRIIKTTTANPAALLDSNFFEQLGHGQKKMYIKAIVQKIMSEDFLTKAGIRSRALSAANLIDHADYHGSLVSWPKETYDIAKGLNRQGFPRLSRQLENRLVNIVLKNRGQPEFLFVDSMGRVYPSKPTKHAHANVESINSPNSPEHTQAWTASAMMAIISGRLSQKFRNRKPRQQELWQKDLEAEILANIPHVDRLLNPIALAKQYPKHRYKLSRTK